MREPALSVVIPVYNSSAVLPALLARLQPVLAAQSAAYEVILVNDGSQDPSWEVIHDLARRHRWVRGINLMRNYGQHNALLCGIRAAAGSVIVTMDDDLQHPPEEVPRLLAKLAEGHDVVYGTPTARPHGLWRNLASACTKLVLRQVLGAATARQVSAFRAFRTHLRAAFADCRVPLVSCDVLLTWGTTRFAAVPVRHEPRRVGTSQYTLRKLLAHALNMATGFSVFPLQLATLVGLLLVLAGGGTLTAALAGYWLGATVPGLLVVAAVVALLSGGQFLALGIIGEYLARMYARAMNRPLYMVQGRTESAPAATASHSLVG